MKKFTLDTNCIIDLEEDRPDAVFVREIIKAWKSRRIELAVVAVSASENQKRGTANSHFSEFEQKIDRVGLSGTVQLLPLMKWDIYYWDHALWSDDEMEALAIAIQNVLFPNSNFALPQDIEKNSSWRNKQCDILTAWSHAFHKWDYLVTRDQNFHDRKVALKSLGVPEIVHPKEAALLCRT